MNNESPTDPTTHYAQTNNASNKHVSATILFESEEDEETSRNYRPGNQFPGLPSSPKIYSIQQSKLKERQLNGDLIPDQPTRTLSEENKQRTPQKHKNSVAITTEKMYANSLSDEEPGSLQIKKQSSSTEETKDSKESTLFIEDFEQIGEIYDTNLFNTINEAQHIQEIEQQLEVMKTTITDKKKLQRERNVVTAKLSRDRKKLEVELMRQACLEMIQAFNVLKNKTARMKSALKCSNCNSENKAAQRVLESLQNFEFRN